jgi:hypothetical protein
MAQNTVKWWAFVEFERLGKFIAILLTIRHSRKTHTMAMTIILMFLIIILSGVCRPLFGLLYQPQMIDDCDCGAIGGMKIGRGNRSTSRKPAPVPLCQPQIQHDLNRARILAAEVGNQRLTA